MDTAAHMLPWEGEVVQICEPHFLFLVKFDNQMSDIPINKYLLHSQRLFKVKWIVLCCNLQLLRLFY